jgi:hypothetical protein
VNRCRERHHWTVSVSVGGRGEDRRGFRRPDRSHTPIELDSPVTCA